MTALDALRRGLAPGAAALAVATAIALAARAPRADAERCGPGFFPRGPRCCPGPRAEGGVCKLHASEVCPPPLVRDVAGACDAPRVRVWVAAADLLVGPSDWEAEGRVAARAVRTGPFTVDAFEVTLGRLCARVPCAAAQRAALDGGDHARAAEVDHATAAAFCAAEGARLPSADEWIAAAATRGQRSPPRYPWGSDAGAVCRRAAWGLAHGPCGAFAGTPGFGPDTVGAHPAGTTFAGGFAIHDLAGNAAEWTREGITKGGSVRTRAVYELRLWAEGVAEGVAEGARTAGFRCVRDE